MISQHTRRAKNSERIFSRTERVYCHCIRQARRLWKHLDETYICATPPFVTVRCVCPPMPRKQSSRKLVPCVLPYDTGDSAIYALVQYKVNTWMLSLLIPNPRWWLVMNIRAIGKLFEDCSRAKLLRIRGIRPQNGTAVLTVLNTLLLDTIRYNTHKTKNKTGAIHTVDTWVTYSYLV